LSGHFKANRLDPTRLIAKDRMTFRRSASFFTQTQFRRWHISGASGQPTPDRSRSRLPDLPILAGRTARRAAVSPLHHLLGMHMIKRLLATMLALFTAAAFAAVDVNKATQAELESIKGIGPGISAKILDERKKGSFKDWQDMVDRVKGVGEGNAAKLSAEGLTVNGATFTGAPAKAAAPAAKKDDKPAAKAAPEAKKDAAAPAAAPAPAAAAAADAKAAPMSAADKKAAAKKEKEDKKAAKAAAAEEAKTAKAEKAAAKKAAKDSPPAAAAASAPAKK
jgi:competence protein ComEA